MLVGSGFRVLGSRISEDLVSTMLIVVGLGIKAAVSVSRVLLPRDFRYTESIQLKMVSQNRGSLCCSSRVARTDTSFKKHGFQKC